MDATIIGYKIETPTTMYEDNQRAIEIAKNPRFHNRIKHIDIKFIHFIPERIVSNELKVVHCNSNDMLADVMTKALPKDQFPKLRKLLIIDKF